MTLPRDVATPLVAYFAVTVGVPLCGGSGREPAFWTHTATIVAVAAALILVRLLAHPAQLTKPEPDAID